MHQPGHNPYQTITPQETFSEYGYQGFSPDIMSALQGVFDFGDLTDFHQLGGTSPFTVDAMTSPVGDYYDQWYGIDTGLGLTDIFDPASIAHTLSEIGGFGDTPIRAGEIQALTPEMLEKTESKYYDPYESSGRVGLVEKLGKNIAGAQTGGFAGSVARQSGLSAAERMYSSGYGDLLSDIMKMRGSATEDVMDTIYGWSELLAEQS